MTNDVISGVTPKVLPACFQVANEMGHGFLEGVCEKALIIALREQVPAHP